MIGKSCFGMFNQVLVKNNELTESTILYRHGSQVMIYVKYAKYLSNRITFALISRLYDISVGKMQATEMDVLNDLESFGISFSEYFADYKHE